MVQTSIFRNSYRTLKLDEVSRAVLSKQNESLDTGKYKGLTGKEIQALSVEEQKNYVLRDAELVMKLSKHNNSKVLNSMKAISEIIGLDFGRVCKTGLSAWWATIFDETDQNGVRFDSVEERSEFRYIGGVVFQPKRGLYHGLIVMDVTSLYPTMSILYNISFDTVKCECCKNDSECRVSDDITKDCKVQKDYWICKRKEGAFTLLPWPYPYFYP